MALDKQFLKYKLEKIKNDRIFKDQDTETKRIIRKENAKLAQEEADAIHSYLTGEDTIDKFDNKSFLENSTPGSLYLNRKNQLDIIQVQTDPTTKRTKLSKILKFHKTIGNANLESSRGIAVFKKILNRLNIEFGLNSLLIGGDLKIEKNETIGRNLKVDGDLTVGGSLNLSVNDKDENFQLGDNGYTYLPNGIILQWGTGTSTSDDEESFEFPIAFPNACFNVVTQRTNGDSQDILPVQNVTTTNFEINRNSAIDGEQPFYWQAIGN